MVNIFLPGGVCTFFLVNVKSMQKRVKRASITVRHVGVKETGGNKPRDKNDPRKIASFVDPDPDGRIRSSHLACRDTLRSSVLFFSLPLSFESLPLLDATSSPFARNFSYSLSLYLSPIATLRRSRHLVHSTKTKGATGLTCSGEERRRERKKKETNLGTRREA